ncbi:hypothetical protein IYX23_08530 [Methylocystis sp. L43]|jgi:hypothetical protein|uniref:hypothetical protein n=1 Tax=unclassified Methylocystis TaxID=2625913 RepID=UPI0018C2FD69|nr:MULTISPECIES: hypothetical protein [unclassified Methylocystis]MBG0797714.1 hypothetical protein [Methylocystis sp. L43]MBG0805320.1 hypothetical protein [Methylocystis sp. H15]
MLGIAKKIGSSESENKAAARGRDGRLLSGYLVNLHRGAAPVRELMLADIERFQSLGATGYADDLRTALKRFTSEFIDLKDRR